MSERTTEQWREEFAMAEPEPVTAVCEACGEPGSAMVFASSRGETFRVHLCKPCFRLLPGGDMAISRMRMWRARFGFAPDEPLTQEDARKLEKPPPWTVWK